MLIRLKDPLDEAMTAGPTQRQLLPWRGLGDGEGQAPCRNFMYWASSTDVIDKNQTESKNL